MSRGVRSIMVTHARNITRVAEGSLLPLPLCIWFLQEEEALERARAEEEARVLLAPGSVAAASRSSRLHSQESKQRAYLRACFLVVTKRGTSLHNRKWYRTIDLKG